MACKQSDGSYVTKDGVKKKRVAIVLTEDELRVLKIKAAGHRSISDYIREALELHDDPTAK